MPNETQTAVNWALTQSVEYPWGVFPISKDLPDELVMKVRDYFNEHNVVYESFSYNDLIPYLL